MYAVIKTGGKQYPVRVNDQFRVAKIEQELGAVVDFNEVLLLSKGADVTVGTPLVKGSVVKAEIVSHGRGDKVKIIKFRRRKHHMKQMGHRQDYSEIKITEIN